MSVQESTIRSQDISESRALVRDILNGIVNDACSLKKRSRRVKRKANALNQESQQACKKSNDIRKFLSKSQKTQKKRVRLRTTEQPKNIKHGKDSQVVKAMGVNSMTRDTINKWWERCAGQRDASINDPWNGLQKRCDLSNTFEILGQDSLYETTDTSFDTDNSGIDEQPTKRELLQHLHSYLHQKQSMEKATINQDDADSTSNTTDIDMAMDNPNPHMMDVSMVITMFNDLKVKVDNIQSANKNMSQNVAVSVGNHLQKQISMISTEQQKKIEKLETELRRVKHQNKALVSAMESYAMEFNDLEKRVENLETNNAKKAITLTNYKMGKKKWEQLRDLYKLFEEILKVDVIIDDFYTIGDENTPTAVIFFQSSYDKRIVMKNKYKLKDITSAQKKQCYINKKNT